ncbi:glycosyltransferase family 39 protein [bacterium]|nr:glycosyltransferase family 39 protein [bacterium]
MISEDLVPYRDFWENHTPLFHLIISLLLKFLPERPETVIYLRFVLVFPLILIFYLVNLLIKSSYDLTVFLYAFLFLSFHKWFIDKSSEVRPDVILVVFSLAGLYYWIKGLDHYWKKPLFLSGLFIGLGFITSPKVIIILISMIISFLIHQFTGYRLKSVGIYTLIFSSFFAGILIPILFFTFYLLFNNALTQFFQCFYIGILKNPNYFSPASYVRESFFINFVFWIAGITGIIYYIFNYLRKFFNKKQNSTFHITIITAIIFQYLVFHWFMPSPYPQSALIIFPLMSIYSGAMIFKLEEYIRKRWRGFRRVPIYTFILLLIVIPPLYSFIVKDKDLVNKNFNQKAMIDFILDNTDKKIRVFDCQGFYMFRKPTSYYGVLVKDILIAMEKGLIKYDIPADLIKNNCMMAIPDYRWSMLPSGLKTFFEENFIFIKKYGILVPGKVFDGIEILLPINFKLLMDCNYYLSTIPPEREIKLDGKTILVPANLSKGIHYLELASYVDKIIILPEFTRNWNSDILNVDDISKAVFK